MAVDPTEPDTFEDTFKDEDGAREFDVEAPENDAVEQLADVTPHGDAPLTGENTDRANEADLAEQARVVELDEDDYR